MSLHWMVISVLLFCGLPCMSQSSDSLATKQLEGVMGELDSIAQAKVLAYARFMLQIQRESPEARLERHNIADRVIPSEETAQNIMEFSRYMVMEQQRESDHDKIPEGERTSILFDEREFDFGTVKEGRRITCDFSFTNTGAKPLEIDTVSAACGCTTPEWPRAPIPPGGKGTIQVVFDTSKKSGRQLKLIFVRANIEAEGIPLFLKGYVE